jgi:WD40 repeat protein
MHHVKTVVAVASSRDGRYIVTGSENTARVFEAKSGRQVSSLTHGGAVNAVSLSADGHWVATGSSDGTARVFGALDGRETLRHSNDEQREVAAVAFSPSGQQVATGSAIFEAANGYQVARVPTPAGVNQMAVSADGDFLATISDKAFAAGEGGRVRVVDLRTGKPVGPPFGVRDQFIAVSDRGRFVAAGDGGGVDIVDVASHASRTLDFPSEAVASLDLSPDGRFVVIAEGKTVHLMDTATGKPASTIPPFAEPVSVVAFSYDGKSFAVGSREPRVRVFSVATGKPLAAVADGLPHEFAGARCKPPSQPCRVSSLSFSRDGKHLATGSDDRTARVFDLGNGREEASLPHVGPVVYAVFTREDARYLATSSNDFIGRVFDVSSRNEMWHMPLRVDDFFPLQFTDRDKYVLWAASIGDEVLVERHPWRLQDMLDDACAIVSRDLTPEEWKPYSDLELQACPASANRPR